MQVFPPVLHNGPLWMYLFNEHAAPDTLTVHCRRLQGVYSAWCRVIVFNQMEDKMCCDSFSFGSDQIGHLAYTNTHCVWEWAYWPTSLFIFWPLWAEYFLYVGQGRCGMQLCMMVYINVDSIHMYGYREMQFVFNCLVFAVEFRFVFVFFEALQGLFLVTLNTKEGVKSV